MRPMTHMFVAVHVALAVVTAHAQSPPASGAAVSKPQVEQAFAAGGSIHMDLSAGRYIVTPTNDPKIRIRWATGDAAEAHSVEATAKVQGTQARIDVSGPSKNFTAWIDVPARSNVTVSLSAGEFSIGVIDGDLDVSAWAGKMDVTVADPSSYYSVAASVTAGRIGAAPFKIEKEGVFRSFSWEGKGRHSLRVRLTAGEIELRPATPGTGQS